MSDPVARYLDARGIALAELPPDMLRELTRLLSDSGPSAFRDTPLPDRDLREIQNSLHEHSHDMLTFEMYLAAWIAKEGICNKPRARKKISSPRQS